MNCPLCQGIIARHFNVGLAQVEADCEVVNGEHRVSSKVTLPKSIDHIVLQLDVPRITGCGGSEASRVKLLAQVELKTGH